MLQEWLRYGAFSCGVGRIITMQVWLRFRQPPQIQKHVTRRVVSQDEVVIGGIYTVAGTESLNSRQGRPAVPAGGAAAVDDAVRDSLSGGELNGACNEPYNAKIEDPDIMLTAGAGVVTHCCGAGAIKDASVGVLDTRIVNVWPQASSDVLQCCKG